MWIRERLRELQSFIDKLDELTRVRRPSGRSGE